ncbi:hypothetical protein Tco_0911729 [Tanacetum coccineum]|uniref:Uncharacterized protein n=1 Tax=Tanacetum coccineum TaxID=301880 RepID=A0ABQ5D2Y5_9ASTR
MAEPNLNDYIYITRKNFLSGDNEGRMVEKNFFEIQGTFLVKIRDNAFNGTMGENAIEHIDYFLKVVGPFKVKGVSQDRLRFSIFPISLAGAATDEDDNPDDISEIFKIEGNLFDFETPLCKAFNEFNYLLKINTDLFAFDIQEIKTYEEYKLNMTRDLEEPWTDNGDHKWYDELADGVLKEEALIHKAKFKESWGDATPGVIKFYAWLNNSFENFHELDYDDAIRCILGFGIRLIDTLHRPCGNKIDELVMVYSEKDAC